MSYARNQGSSPLVAQMSIRYVPCLLLVEAQNAALCLVPDLEALQPPRALGHWPTGCWVLQAGNRAVSSTKLIPTCRHEQKEALLSRSHFLSPLVIVTTSFAPLVQTCHLTHRDQSR